MDYLLNYQMTEEKFWRGPRYFNSRQTMVPNIKHCGNSWYFISHDTGPLLIVRKLFYNQGKHYFRGVPSKATTRKYCVYHYHINWSNGIFLSLSYTYYGEGRVADTTKGDYSEYLLPQEMIPCNIILWTRRSLEVLWRI